MKTLIQRELDRKISATVDGRMVMMARREVVARRLVDEGMKGNLKAIEALLRQDEIASAGQAALPPIDTDPAQESAILAAYLERRGTGTSS